MFDLFAQANPDGVQKYMVLCHSCLRLDMGNNVHSLRET